MQKTIHTNDPETENQHADMSMVREAKQPGTKYTLIEDHTSYSKDKLYAAKGETVTLIAMYDLIAIVERDKDKSKFSVHIEKLMIKNGK